jgi:hypothetical protein
MHATLRESERYGTSLNISPSTRCGFRMDVVPASRDLPECLRARGLDRFSKGRLG